MLSQNWHTGYHKASYDSSQTDRSWPLSSTRQEINQQAVSALVLAGTALIAAVFLPNVEFIFGLAGSTASVLIAYILPAAIFLVVSRPPKQPTGTLISIGSPTLMSAQSAEVSSPREGGMQQLNPWGVKGPRRKAWTLLVFGMVVAVVCTRATLTAVQQEAEVVLLAQELVASEAAVSLFISRFHFRMTFFWTTDLNRHQTSVASAG